MEKNFLNKYVLDLLDSLEQNLSAFTKTKKPEFLHHLRVDIKKINALYSFAEHIFKEKHDATKLKPLFHKAGEIWEMHINISLVSEVPHPPERLIAWLKKKVNLLSKQFIKNGPRYSMRIKDFRKKISLPEVLPGKKTIIKYFKKERKKTDKMRQHVVREGMHRYRKKIKKIMYVYSALPKSMQYEIELNVAKMDKQQKKLGDWHDTYAAIEKFSIEHFPTQTSDMLMLKEKEAVQFNMLRKQLTKKRK